MNKNLIRLTEQDLHKIVKESVKKVIKEENDNKIRIFGKDWKAQMDKITNRFVNPYRPFLSDRFFNDVKNSFIEWFEFYAVGQNSNGLSEETCKEWIKGRIGTMMEDRIRQAKSEPYGIPYADMLRMGRDFDHSTM